MFKNIFFTAQHILSALRDQPKPLDEPLVDLLPYGLPDARNPGLVYIYRHGYIVAYDPVNFIPKWVCWRVNADKINSLDVPRRDCFERDESLIESAMPIQYNNSGFDLGHMCDCEDMSYSVLTQRESFILTNIVPQAPHFNRGIWGALERQTRNMVKASSADHWVLAVSVYDDTCPKIADTIVIPNVFEKLIVNMKTHATTMYSFAHTSPWAFSDDLESYKVDRLMDVKLGNIIP